MRRKNLAARAGSRCITAGQRDPRHLYAQERGADLVAIDDALNTLATRDARKSQIVELRFLGGLTVEETAEVLKISPRTVKREWSLARAWLYCELTQDKAPEE